MGRVCSSLRRGAAMLAVSALLLFPVAASADAGEIRLPPGAPASQSSQSSQSVSAAAEISVPPGLWDAVLLVWLEAIL